MARLGGYLIFFAIASAVLSQTNYQFTLLAWMEDMGSGAWVVRAVMVAIGVALVLAGTSQKQPQQQQYR